MAIAIVYGTSACVIATAVCILAVFLKAEKFRTAFLASFAGWVCDAFLYSMAFRLALPADAAAIKDLLFSAAVMALVSFLFNSLLITTVVSWRLGKKISWVRTFLPLFPNWLVAAGTAVLIALWSKDIPLVLIAVAPVIALIWWWTRFHSARLLREAIPSKA